MVRLLLILQLFALGYPTPPPVPAVFQQQAADDADDPSLLRDGPDPAPLTGHGAYEHARGWFCTKAPTNEAVKNVQCACVEKCLNGGAEDHSCQTSCNSRRCRCHEDDSKCSPEVMPTPKPKKGRR